MALDLGKISADLEIDDQFTDELEKAMGVTIEQIEEVRDQMAEAAKVGQAVDEAMKRMGITYEEWNVALKKNADAQRQAAAEMDTLHDEALKMNEAIGQSGSSFEKFGAALMSGSIKDAIGAFMELPAAFVAIGAGAMKAFEAVSALASEAERLSNKSLTLGMSTDAVQGLERLAENAGVSADAVERSLQKMQRAAVDNSKAFQTLGISQRDFLAMGTEEQLKSIADHIMSLGTATERSAEAMRLFGRGAAEQMLPVLKALNEGELPRNIALSEEQLARLMELDDANDLLSGSWKDLTNQVTQALVEFTPLPEVIHAVGEAIHFTAQAIADAIPWWSKQIDKVKEMYKEQFQLAGLMDQTLPKISKTTEVQSFLGKNLALGGPADLGLMDPLAALEKMNQDIIKSTGQTFEAYVKGADTAAKEVEKLEKEHKKQEDALLKVEIEYNRIQAAGDAAFALAGVQQYGKELDDLVNKTTKLAKEAEAGMNSIFDPIKDTAGIDVIGPILKKMTAELPGVAFNFTKTFKASLKELPDVIVGAIQGGGDVFKAIGAKVGGDLFSGFFEEGGKAMGFLKDKLGDSLGGLVGSFAGPIGSLVGSVVGKGVTKLVGALGIGGNKEVMQVNDLRDAFFEAHGGFVQVQKDLQGLTDQDLVKKIFNAKTVEEFNSATREVMDLMNLQGESQQALNDAIEKYGFTIEELGPKFAQQQMDEQALTLIQDFELLKASGIDVNTIIERMGPSLNEFVQQSISAGTAIPEAMRPVIEQMIASGQLLDENGNAYESVEEAGITFAQTMDEKFTTLIDKITQMVNALLGIPTDVNTNVNVHTNYTSSGGGPSGAPDESYRPGNHYEHNAAGGIVSTPGWSMVAERGPEAIIPVGELGRLGGGSTAELQQMLMQFGAQQQKTMTKAIRDALVKTGR